MIDTQKEREAFEKEMLDSKYVAGNISAFWDEKTQNYDIAITELRMAWHAWQAKAQAVPEVKTSRRVTLTCAQLREAFMFGAPDKDDQEQLETEMTITWSENGHSGKGYYCYYSDLPEEGAIFLDEAIEAQEQTND